ncbi:MAG: hypothetical protein ACKVOU_06350 [Cytophagales bacterium]
MKFKTKFAPFLCFFSSMLLFEACSKKHFICPAYNSYFIHDQELRDSRFSLFIEDSLSGASNQQNTDSQDTTNRISQNTVEQNESNSINSKFQPKEKFAKKTLPNGLLLANASKHKTPRAMEEIEMKIVMVKPQSRYSNIDSSTVKSNSKQPELRTDSL